MHSGQNVLTPIFLPTLTTLALTQNC